MKTYLESSNVKDIVGKIRSSFPKCNYFSVAAYGVPITGEEKVQKAPYGIALPFLWTEAALGYLIPTAMIKKYPKKKLFQKEAGEPVTILKMRKKSCMPNRGTKMQLLYGNDGMNYHTIAKSSEMTPAQEKELLKDYLRYDLYRMIVSILLWMQNLLQLLV